MKRRLAVIIGFVSGLYWFFEFFWHEFDLTGIGVPFWENLTDYRNLNYEIALAVGASAIGLGLINIIRVHGSTMLRLRKGWYNSLALFVAMILMMIFGFWDRYGMWEIDKIIDPGQIGSDIASLQANGTDIKLTEITRTDYAHAMPRVKQMRDGFEHFSGAPRREYALTKQWEKEAPIINKLFDRDDLVGGMLSTELVGPKGGSVTFPIGDGHGKTGWKLDDYTGLEMELLVLPEGLNGLVDDMNVLMAWYQARKEESSEVSVRRRKMRAIAEKVSKEALTPMQKQFLGNRLLVEDQLALEEGHLKSFRRLIGVTPEEINEQSRRKVLRALDELESRLARVTRRWPLVVSSEANSSALMTPANEAILKSRAAVKTGFSFGKAQPNRAINADAIHRVELVIGINLLRGLIQEDIASDEVRIQLVAALNHFDQQLQSPLEKNSLAKAEQARKDLHDALTGAFEQTSLPRVTLTLTDHIAKLHTWLGQQPRGARPTLSRKSLNALASAAQKTNTMPTARQAVAWVPLLGKVEEIGQLALLSSYHGIATTSLNLLSDDQLAAGREIVREMELAQEALEALNLSVGVIDKARKRTLAELSGAVSALTNREVEQIISPLRDELVFGRGAQRAAETYEKLFEYFREHQETLTFNGGWATVKINLQALFQARIPYWEEKRQSDPRSARALSDGIVDQLNQLPAQIQNREVQTAWKVVQRSIQSSDPNPTAAKVQLKVLIAAIEKAENWDLKSESDRRTAPLYKAVAAWHGELNALVDHLERIQASREGVSGNDIQALISEIESIRIELIQTLAQNIDILKQAPEKTLTDDARALEETNTNAAIMTKAINALTSGAEALVKSGKGTTAQTYEEEAASGLQNVQQALAAIGKNGASSWKAGLSKLTTVRIKELSGLLKGLETSVKQATTPSYEKPELNEQAAALNTQFQSLSQQVAAISTNVEALAQAWALETPNMDAVTRNVKELGAVEALEQALQKLASAIVPTQGTHLLARLDQEQSHVQDATDDLLKSIEPVTARLKPTTKQQLVAWLGSYEQDLLEVERAKATLAKQREELTGQAAERSEQMNAAINRKTAFLRTVLIRRDTESASKGSALYITLHSTNEQGEQAISFRRPVSTKSANSSRISISAKQMKAAGVDLNGLTAVTLSSEEPMTVHLLTAGFVRKGSLFIAKEIWEKVLFYGLLNALGATMFSLLAFYIISASYRAFRVHTMEAALLMVVAFIVMLGQIPAGTSLWEWMSGVVYSTLGIDIGFGIGDIKQWLLLYVNGAAQRAVGFGSALAGFAISLRIWLGMERGIY